jgi:hypothetical protein
MRTRTPGAIEISIQRELGVLLNRVTLTKNVETRSGVLIFSPMAGLLK